MTKPVPLILAAALAAAAACGPEAPDPAPRVVSVAPEGEGIPPDAPAASVLFSDPVEPSGVEDGRFVALATEAEARSVAAAAATVTGIPSGAAAVPARVRLVEDGRRAEITPDGPLEPLAAYAVVVGTGVRSVRGPLVLDPTGRKRAFATVFRTGPMPDRVPPAARWIWPPHGPVPTNVKELRVGFSEAVTGSLSVHGAGGRTRSVAPDVLALALDAPLPAGAVAPVLDDVRDGGGNRPAPLPAIAVAACKDDRPPVLAAGSVRILPADTAITAASEASEVTRLGLEVAAERPGDGCGALPALPATLVAWGDFAACPGHDPCGAPARCPVAATVPGLCPGQRVRIRLLAEDLAGNAATAGEWMVAATGAPVARLALTEVLADASTPQAGGEYVEIANLGSGDADLGGHHLAKRSASGAVSRCTIEPQGGPLPAGAHGLIVGGGWDGRYKVPAGVPLFRCGATALAGGLADDRAPALALESPAGAVLSGIGWSAPAIRCTGRSLERVHPGGEDATANLACAVEAPGTPGACNGTTPPAECPRRAF